MRIIFLSLLLALLTFSYIYLFLNQNLSFNFSNEVCIPVPAVTESRGEITYFCLYTKKGNGKIFVENVPIKDFSFQISLEFAKLATCHFSDKCLKYDYFLRLKDVKTEIVRGASGSAGYFILTLSAIENLIPRKDLTVTGFVLPSGLILPVAGIEKKKEAAHERGLKLVSPEQNNGDIKVNDIFDLYSLFFNKRFSFRSYIPEDYWKIIKEIAEDICKNVTNKKALELLKEGKYYSAASLCFIEKSKRFKMNITEDEIKKFKEKVEKIKCETTSCEEIKYQVLKRRS